MIWTKHFCKVSDSIRVLQLEPEKYEEGIVWIRELLYQTKLTPERLRIIAAKIVNDVAQVKRKGNTMVKELMKGLIYNKGKYNKLSIEHISLGHGQDRLIRSGKGFTQRGFLIGLEFPGGLWKGKLGYKKTPTNHLTVQQEATALIGASTSQGSWLPTLGAEPWGEKCLEELLNPVRETNYSRTRALN